MSRTEKLRQHHNELVDLVGQIQKCLSGNAAAEVEKISGLLTTMTGKLTVHLAMEDNVLYPHMIAAPDAATSSAAKKFQTEMSGIKDVYIAFTKKWGKTAIANDTAGFAKDFSGIAAALAQRITRENNELYPLADKLG